LLYYPSSTLQDSWLSVTGALLDAATLVTCAISSQNRGRAELFYALGCATVQSLCQSVELKKEDSGYLTREEFDQALEFLAFAGFSVVDSEFAWKTFKLKREGYAGYIAALSAQFDNPKQAWIKELRISHLANAAKSEPAVIGAKQLQS
jgi:hypothetical protein